MGAPDVSLEDKTLTVVYGPDFVNVNFINFCTDSKEIAQVRRTHVRVNCFIVH